MSESMVIVELPVGSRIYRGADADMLHINELTITEPNGAIDDVLAPGEWMRADAFDEDGYPLYSIEPLQPCGCGQYR